MKTDIWMPIYIGDFFKDTLHLTSEEKGLYLLCLCHFWNNNGFMLKQRLMSTLGFSQTKFEKKMKNILTFFSENENGLHQKRLLFELEKSKKNREIKAISGKLGGLSKPNGNQLVNQMGKQNSTSSSSPSSSPTPLKEKKERVGFSKPTVTEISQYCLERKNTVDAEHFFDHYQARGWKLSNGKTVVDWKACVRTWEKNNFKKVDPFEIKKEFTLEDFGRG